MTSCRCSIKSHLVVPSRTLPYKVCPCGAKSDGFLSPDSDHWVQKWIPQCGNYSSVQKLFFGTVIESSTQSSLTQKVALGGRQCLDSKKYNTINIVCVMYLKLICKTVTSPRLPGYPGWNRLNLNMQPHCAEFDPWVQKWIPQCRNWSLSTEIDS
jgi:hypothetical protein